MKLKKKYILSILVFFFILGFKNTSNPIFINGHLKPKNKVLKNKVFGLKIFVKANSKILAESYCDKNGNFNLTFTPENEKSFDFYCSGIGIGTILLKSVSNFESDNIKMNLDFTSKYLKNKKGEIICIKCNKSDKTYKIGNHGMPIISKKVNVQGDTIYRKIYSITDRESRSINISKYYCERDNVKF